MGMGWTRLKALAVFAVSLLLAGCNLPSSGSGNPIQTALALTLSAAPRVEASATAIPTTDPDAPPIGKIVYVCQFSKLRARNQLCLINADGSNWRLLTPNSDYDNFYPSLSPDGKAVLFSSNRSGSYQIYELNLESGDLEQLTNLSSRDAFAPAVSPDGQRIVFTVESSGSAPGNQNLWLMNRDGSDAQALTARSGGAWDAAWSPDGAQILFASEVGGDPQLFIMDADGTGIRQVTDLDGIRGRNDWSPDGVTLATYIGTPWKREIYLFDLEGENLVAITEGGNNLAPSFSPDGNWVAFTSYRDHYQQALGCEIYIVRIDGSEATRLTDNDICDWQPRWGL